MSSTPVEAPEPKVNRVVAGRFDEGPSYRTWRTHGTDDWLLIHTEDGQGRFGLPTGSGELISQPGDALLIRPGGPHDYGTGPAGRWVLQFAHFHPRTDWLPLLDWTPVVSGPGSGWGRIRLSGEPRRRFEAALGRMVALERSGLEQAELFALNALEEALLWASTQRPGPGALDPRLLAVLELIGSRLAEPLDVARLASAVALSPSRLSHLFRDQLGVSVRDFVERQRMQAAQQLLQLSGRTVTEVANAVGYHDPLYFSSRFKRFSGRSPSSFRG